MPTTQYAIAGAVPNRTLTATLNNLDTLAVEYTADTVVETIANSGVYTLAFGEAAAISGTWRLIIVDSATALGVACVKAGKAVYRATLAELIDALLKAEREGKLVEKLRFYARASLLIVDEIGYLPVSTGGANLFFQLVNARYEKGAMILTSNRGFAEWGDVFGDPVVATALLDRLLHHAVVIQIEGSSYRLRGHLDLIPEHIRAYAPIAPPPPPKRKTKYAKKENLDE